MMGDIKMKTAYRLQLELVILYRKFYRLNDTQTETINNIMTATAKRSNNV